MTSLKNFLKIFRHFRGRFLTDPNLGRMSEQYRKFEKNTQTLKSIKLKIVPLPITHSHRNSRAESSMEIRHVPCLLLLTEGYVDAGALKGHQGRQRLHLICADVHRVPNT